MKNIFRMIVLTVLLAVSLQPMALASWVMRSDGYDQTARTNQDLYLRVEPSAYTEGLGTFRISGQWVSVSGRAWDDENHIWWIRCSFNYNGRYVVGWTGAKRFDSSTYDLYGLPEYDEIYDYYDYDYDYDYDSGYGSQQARANQQLYLRSYADPSTQGLGTYYVSGQWITLTAKHWDDVNNIYWVKCDFYYNGSHIVGWTGAKRFDSSTYSLDALPYE